MNIYEQINRTLFTTFVFLCLVGSVCAEKLSIDQIMEAVCRVETKYVNEDESRVIYGSGTCIKFIDDKYIILTNQHVVRDEKKVKVEFFRNGYKTIKIPAKVIWSAQGDLVDFAFLEVSKDYFGDYPPRVIPIVKNYTLKSGQSFITAGCPEARWLRAMEGHVLSNDGIVYFTPPARPGQSGSGIFVHITKNGETNTKLVAIITWYFGEDRLKPNGYNNSVGGAIPINNLHEVINLNNKTHRKE